MILHADHESYDSLIVPGTPLKSAGHDNVPKTRAPKLGESTDQVLSALLGYDEKRLSELRGRSII